MRRYVLPVIAAFCFLNIQHAQNLRVATYNVRYENKHDSVSGNGWQQRCPIITQLILFHDFDIFGAQEVLSGQLKDMLHFLAGYSYTGVGRNDGMEAGEFAPIFYKNDKISLLQPGHFWLSETDDKPSTGWDAALPRICTWGKFQTKKDSFLFWVFNLHMDHIGEKARLESSKLVLRKINSMCAGEPVILTGDFNMDQTSEGYKILSETEFLNDTYESAGIRYLLNGTFNDFDPNLKTNSRIDHIFISKGFHVLRYGILTDSYRVATGGSSHQIRLPSDHYPVLAEISFKSY